MRLFNLHIEWEKWRFNSEFNIYVSSLGNFRDSQKKPLRPLVNNSGYMAVKTSQGMVVAHRLVLATFCPRTDWQGLTVDHIDSNKRNNTLKNLEWVSKEENNRRAMMNKLSPADELIGAVAAQMYQICYNNQIFNTAEEAYNYIVKTNHYQGSFERFKNRITNSFRAHTAFCDGIWMFVPAN